MCLVAGAFKVQLLESASGFESLINYALDNIIRKRITEHVWYGHENNFFFIPQDDLMEQFPRYIMAVEKLREMSPQTEQQMKLVRNLLVVRNVIKF